MSPQTHKPGPDAQPLPGLALVVDFATGRIVGAVDDEGRPVQCPSPGGPPGDSAPPAA